MFVDRLLHRFHPIMKLRYLFHPLLNRKRKDEIPKDTEYCYGENGNCPFIIRVESNRHGFSPFRGFRWCTYVNDGDYPDINDCCKICNEFRPSYEEDDYDV